MTVALMLFLLAALLPVFFAKLRVLPLWLSVQGLALAAMDWVQAPAPTLHSLATLLEVLLLRAALAPWLLRRAMVLCGGAERDLMPSNLFTWVAAVSLIALAFHFFGASSSAPDALALGVVATRVLLAFLLLASNAAPLAQLVALLYIENAIAVFEALLPQGWPLPVHLALGLVYLGTITVAQWLLGQRTEASL